MSYFETDAISQSYLKALLYGGDESKNDDSKSLTLGSIVDSIVTQPIREFVNKYAIIDYKPSDTMEKISYTTLAYMNEEDIPMLDALKKSIEAHGYIGNKAWTIEQKVEKVLKEAGGFIDMLVANKNKKLISKQDYEHASLISTHITRCINQINVGNEQVLYQKEIYFYVIHKEVFDDEVTYVYPAKALLDVVIIDYANKIIQPIDVKYCSDKFEYSAKKYRYDIQASFYTTALQNEYPDYTIKPFIFVVGYDNYKAEIYQVTDLDLYVGEYGAKRIYAETYTPHQTIRNETDIFGWRDGVKLHHEIKLDIKTDELIKRLDLWN